VNTSLAWTASKSALDKQGTAKLPEMNREDDLKRCNLQEYVWDMA
jgi:hypothetical protein